LFQPYVRLRTRFEVFLESLVLTSLPAVLALQRALQPPSSPARSLTEPRLSASRLMHYDKRYQKYF